MAIQKQLVHDVHEVLKKEPSPEGLHAAAELAYIGGVKSQASGKPKEALDLYGTSVAYAYAYLFKPRYSEVVNPYDPQFREACDLYNASLEATLRAVKKDGKLRPGETITLETRGQTWDITVVPRNVSWPAGDIKQFEFVSDYEINGLANVYHTYGLGVPLIAVRRDHLADDPLEKHYPPGLSFPVTAFLHCLPDEDTLTPALSQRAREEHAQAADASQQANGNAQLASFSQSPSSSSQPPATSGQPTKADPNTFSLASERHHKAVLELYDPLEATDVVVDNHRIPLESDITTPLGYALSDPAFAVLDQPTTGLLNPEKVKKLAGIYMLEPYQPGKIPVLMVHGLWSSPITWMEMFNDLRGDPDLRRDYQFWFYEYPTAQPFWRTATYLRESLARLRKTVDPEGHEAALDQMVLVGHSMGGLISHMQIVNSRDDFWHLVSDRPISLVKADERTLHDLDRTFYFQANTSVRRVITIGTPHRGSHLANDFTEYLGEKLISLPDQMKQMTDRFAMLRLGNPGFFRDTRMIDTQTSLDSLAPDCPALPALLAAQRPPWVKYDNIVGRLPRDNWQVRLFGDGDGVVPYESATWPTPIRKSTCRPSTARSTGIRKPFCRCANCCASTCGKFKAIPTFSRFRRSARRRDRRLAPNDRAAHRRAI